MSQDYIDNCYDDDEPFWGEMDKMEDNFHAIKTNFSGVSELSATDPDLERVPFVPWGDTANKVLKFRNTDNNGWWGHMHADETCVVYVYRGGVLDGWVVDESSSVKDCVVAIKGGEYATGGTIDGDWDFNPIVHNHQWHIGASTTGELWDKDGDLQPLIPGEITYWAAPPTMVRTVTPVGTLITAREMDVNGKLGDAWTSNYGAGGWRPRATVGTLQHLDLTS